MNILFSIIAALWSVAFLSPSDSEKVISSIDSVISSVSRISFSYRYAKTVSLLKEEIKASGYVEIDTESSILNWTKESPSHSAITFTKDDVSGTSVTKDNKQIYRKISKFINSRISSGTIADRKDFRRTVEITERGYILHLEPRSPESIPFFTVMDITFDKSSFILKEIRMTDAESDVTVISISSVKTER